MEASEALTLIQSPGEGGQEGPEDPGALEFQGPGGEAWSTWLPALGPAVKQLLIASALGDIGLYLTQGQGAPNGALAFRGGSVHIVRSLPFVQLQVYRVKTTLGNGGSSPRLRLTKPMKCRRRELQLPERKTV